MSSQLSLTNWSIEFSTQWTKSPLCPLRLHEGPSAKPQIVTLRSRWPTQSTQAAGWLVPPPRRSSRLLRPMALSSREAHSRSWLPAWMAACSLRSSQCHLGGFCGLSADPLVAGSQLELRPHGQALGLWPEQSAGFDRRRPATTKTTCVDIAPVGHRRPNRTVALRWKISPTHAARFVESDPAGRGAAEPTF